MGPYELKLNPVLPKLTDNEFYELCQANSEAKLERTSDGTILVMPPTGGFTGKTNSNITFELESWNRQKKLGVVFDSSTGFSLSNGAIRSPDASWIAQDRWDALSEEEKQRFPPLCPDFVLELMSESDSLAALQKKMEEWRDNGARLGWLLSPRNRKVFIYRPEQPVEELDDYDRTLSGEDVLPDFQLDLRIIK